MSLSKGTPASSQIIWLEGEIKRLEAALAASEARVKALEEALEVASKALVFMRVRGSNAIAAFMRDTSDRTRVVEMLDTLDEAIVVVRAALKRWE